MKLKIFTSAALLCASFAFAQRADTVSTVQIRPENPNIIKTNVTAYAFRNLNLSYERIISKTTSLSASFSVIPSGKVPYVKLFLDGEDIGDVESMVMNYNSITLEPRFYLGKRGYGQGFYLAPYYRYSHGEFSDYRYEFQTIEAGVTETHYVELEGNVTGHSIGVMFGKQWFLGQKKDWVLDFNILGGHYGISKGDLIAVSSQRLTPERQQELQKELDELDVPLVKIDATANENGATAKVSGPWAGLRFGLALGYRF